MIKVSIIVPVYNVEKYLPKCLDSLVNQTLKEIEIIVVNDGSPDNSQKVIDKYAKKYPKLIKSFYKENNGQASARNVGLEYANGKYISFVDSDDWLDLNALELMYNKLESNHAEIAICDMVDHFSNGKELYHDCTNYSFKYQKSGSSCNKIFKRELIGAINRVSNQTKNNDKKMVLKKLTKYCNNNIHNYKKYDFYNYIQRNTKIIAYLNFLGLNTISKYLLKTKKRIVGSKNEKQ